MVIGEPVSGIVHYVSTDGWTDRRTDRWIKINLGGLGNLRFLQVKMSN